MIIINACGHKKICIKNDQEGTEGVDKADKDYHSGGICELRGERWEEVTLLKIPGRKVQTEKAASQRL